MNNNAPGILAGGLPCHGIFISMVFVFSVEDKNHKKINYRAWIILATGIHVHFLVDYCHHQKIGQGTIGTVGSQL